MQSLADCLGCIVQIRAVTTVDKSATGLTTVRILHIPELMLHIQNCCATKTWCVFFYTALHYTKYFSHSLQLQHKETVISALKAQLCQILQYLFYNRRPDISDLYNVWPWSQWPQCKQDIWHKLHGIRARPGIGESMFPSPYFLPPL